MKRQPLSRKLKLLTTLITILMSGCSFVKGPNNADYQVAIKMSEVFETLFFADSEFFRDLSQSPAESQRVLQTPFAMLLAARDLPQFDAVRSRLLNDDASVAVGARNFELIYVDNRPVLPSPIVFEACFVIRYKKSPLNLNSDLHFAPSSELNGRPVWSINFPYGAQENLLTLYFHQTEPNQLLVATGLNVLSEVEALSSRKRTLGRKANQYLSVLNAENSLLWAYRDISKRKATSELRIDPLSGGLALDPRAICVMMSIERDGKGRLRYVSFPQDRTSALLNEFAFHFREQDTGVWEDLIALSNERNRIEQLRVALGFFGFGAVL